MKIEEKSRIRLQCGYITNLPSPRALKRGVINIHVLSYIKGRGDSKGISSCRFNLCGRLEIEIEKERKEERKGERGERQRERVKGGEKEKEREREREKGVEEARESGERG